MDPGMVWLINTPEWLMLFVPLLSALVFGVSHWYIDQHCARHVQSKWGDIFFAIMWGVVGFFMMGFFLATFGWWGLLVTFFVWLFLDLIHMWDGGFEG